ncbi:hypothetical protein ACQP1G_24205 [Nocardia sp. CA-107356]|uniref:hypothetical protein n=1 Tax=Nocardia sp. CA-107356 TaxID=3239972 RepID=UPI003D8A75A4
MRLDEQALASGMQAMMRGIVITAVTTQAISVTMPRDGSVLQGTQFYRDSGGGRR